MMNDSSNSYLTKQCEECGNQFTTLNPNQRFCSNTHFRSCVVCQTTFEVDVKNANSRKKQTCSRKCAAILRKKTISTIVRECEWCHSTFYSESNTTKLCSNQHFSTCKICEKSFPISNEQILNNQVPETCSTLCRNQLRRQTCQDKYGVDVPSMRPESIERARIHSSQMQAQREETCLQRYGVKNVSQSAEVQAKIRTTMNSPEYKQTFKASMQSKYGVNYAMQSLVLRSKQSRGVKKKSSLEIRLHNILTNYSIEYQPEYVIKNANHVHSFDLFLPKYRILVDCDGRFWHSYDSDPDGVMSRDDYDDVRLSLVPQDFIYTVIVESEFERGLNNLLKVIHSIDDGIFNYDSELFNWCRSIGFPYPNYSEARMKSDWNKLCNYNTSKYNPYCKFGMSIISNFHRSIYDCRVENKLSPNAAWNDDNMLKQCITNRLIYQNDVDPSKVLAGFNISKIAPRVSVFNPVTARYLLTKYASRYHSVVDPFSGFSGRLLGAVSLNKQYIGHDIREAAVDESNRIIQFLNLEDAVVTVQDIQAATVKSYNNTCLFTCPPYQHKEVYLEDQMNLTCDEWIQLCLAKYQCDRYLFVVDHTQLYSQYVVEELKSSSHFRNNSELVILIDKQLNR